MLWWGLPWVHVNGRCKQVHRCYPAAITHTSCREHFRELGAALERHRAAAAALQAVERALLCEQLVALEAALQPGLARLNWTSLTIPQFVESVNKVIRGWWGRLRWLAWVL